MSCMHVLLLLAFLLHQQPSRGSSDIGAYQHHCTIQPNLESPFIKAFHELVDVAAGCDSTEITSAGEEVHVISMVGDVTENRGQGYGEVILYLRPRASTTWQQAPINVVLQSSRPTVWRIHSERISNQTRNTFWVSRNSRLVKDSRINVKIRKTSLPADRDGLAAWTRQKYGAITSFTSFVRATTFIKKVGIGSSSDLSSSCVVRDHSYSPSSTPVYLKPQPLAGCVQIQNKDFNHRDVHVLELHTAHSSPHNPTIADIVIDLHALKRSSRHRHLVLILKSHVPVRWSMHTKGVKGILDIITENEVDSTSVRMQEVRVAAERLSDYSGSELLAWVAEKYGPALSYTDVQLANRFAIIIDGAGDVLSVPDHPQSDQNRPRTPDPFNVPQQTWYTIDTHKTVTCGAKGMHVAIQRDQVQGLGVRLEQLSLLDKNCQFTANETHYEIYWVLGDCDNIMLHQETQNTLAHNPQHFQTFFQNAIVVHKLSGGEGSAGGVQAEVTYNDDEDYDTGFSGDEINIGFQCAYHTGNPSSINNQHTPVKASSTVVKSPITPPTPEQRASSEHYALQLYSDSHYTQPWQFPHQITARQTVYAEITLAEDDTRRRPVIQNCWISSSIHSPQQHRYTLVKQGCLEENTMHWLDSNNTGSPEARARRFSFEYVTPSRAVENIVSYLVCEVTSCNTIGVGVNNGVYHCLDSVRYCFEEKILREDKQVFEIASLGLASSGPLLNTDKLPTDINIAAEKSVRGCVDVNGQCKHVVHIEGLDSSTVVCIAFAAFVIGVLLTATLWYIHTHTGELRKNNQPRSVEGSGDSTPNSTAPITIHHVVHP